MVRLNDCCLAVNWLKIHDFRDKACQMSQVRPRLLDDIAMLPNGGHRCSIQRAADARLVARGVQRDDAAVSYTHLDVYKRQVHAHLAALVHAG